MRSSNDRLQNLAQSGRADNDPGFLVIVSFEYHDGPERGFAMYPSGQGVRFLSLGDSASRFFRAFELVSIGGDWKSKVETIRQAGGAVKVLVPAELTDTLKRLDSAVFKASATGLYVGVGSPNFEWMYVMAVDEKQLDRLRTLNGAPDAFQSAHRLIKGGHRMMRQQALLDLRPHT